MEEISFSYKRRQTVSVCVGGVYMGSAWPIRVQSMANTDTNDIEGSVAQARRIAAAGGELVRFTTQGSREVESLSVICQQLNGLIPVVADVHFNPHVADLAAQKVDKVRINPGNYIDPARKFIHINYTSEAYEAELNRLKERFVSLLTLCKEHHTALRIGVNHGSLSDRIMSRYGDTPAGMAESCMEFLRICREEDFSDVVVSVKASSTRVMVETVRLLVRMMDAEELHFPLHLGVTEAGEGEDGRIRSAVGIGALLSEGIGDTIRVSLSEEPEAEIPVAKEIVRWVEENSSLRHCFMEEGRLIYCSEEQTDWATFCLHAAVDLGKPLFDNACRQLRIEHPNFSRERLDILAKDILQAAGVIRYKTEYISCPSCGRTLFDIQKAVAEVKSATKHLVGLKIAVMGCIVNGPGEMADADYGYVGAGRGRVSLYRGKTCVRKNIPEQEALSALLELIETDKHHKEVEG